MSTVEDIFPLYVREPNKIYHMCENIVTCPNSWLNQCYCYYEFPIKTITIGNTCAPCNFEKKCYVKPSEECPICMEPNTSKSKTYLTSCGHSFHKLCIFKSMETNWITNNQKNYNCPICRGKLGASVHGLNERYSHNPNTTILDDLEEFWLKKEFIIPHMCRNKTHFIGMKKNCQQCKKYILTGEFS